MTSRSLAEYFSAFTTNGKNKKIKKDTPCEDIFSFLQISGIIERRRSLSKVIPFRAKQDTSASRQGPVRPVGAYFSDNDRRSVHYPLT